MIVFSNFSETSFDKGFFKKIAEFVLKEEKANKVNISVVFVNSDKIRELNKKYRKNNEVTNVLAFCYESGKRFVLGPKDLVKSGEIVICPEYIKKDKGVVFEQELIRVFIHGILHILGYNHKTPADFKKMIDLQEKYLSLINNF